MDAEVAAGWIGAGAAFVGTMVGAGVSAWATVRTQRHEAKRAVEERQDATRKLADERGQAAGREALAELYTLRRHIHQWAGPADMATHRPWFKAGEEMADKAEMIAGLIPQAPEIRLRLGEALKVTLICMLDGVHGDTTRVSYLGRDYVDHAIEILLAFLRGDPLPEPSAAVVRFRRERAQYDLENPPGAD